MTKQILMQNVTKSLALLSFEDLKTIQKIVFALSKEQAQYEWFANDGVEAHEFLDALNISIKKDERLGKVRTKIRTKKETYA